jgi:DNA repair protein RecO (recombination protein O)
MRNVDSAFSTSRDARRPAPTAHHVSPKSGRAVSRCAGEPWADKMMRLPAFLREPDTLPGGRDLADGFALTGFFLMRHVLEPRGLALGDERAYFIAALARALPSVA